MVATPRHHLAVIRERSLHGSYHVLYCMGYVWILVPVISGHSLGDDQGLRGGQMVSPASLGLC